MAKIKRPEVADAFEEICNEIETCKSNMSKAMVECDVGQLHEIIRDTYHRMQRCCDLKRDLRAS